MKNNLTETLKSLEAKIEETVRISPPQPDPTPEEIEAAAEHARRLAMRQQEAIALGCHTGWPPKYLQAVQTKPEGDEWLAAYDVAQSCVLNNGILVLYGKRGTGKTHMAAELACVVGESRYRTAMRFFLEIRHTFRRDSPKTELDVVEELATTKLLIIDEVQERAESGFENRLLTHLIDARYAAMRPTIIIANLAKRELAESLGPSIVDRARENGKSIEFGWASFRGGKQA